MALAFVGTSAAEAADAQNRFQPYGLGRAYLQAVHRDLRRQERGLQADRSPGWTAISAAYNAIDKGTFDIFRMAVAGAVRAVGVQRLQAASRCAVFVQVVNELIRVVMVPDKLTTASERVKIGDGEACGLFLPRRHQRRSSSNWRPSGFLKSKPDGVVRPRHPGCASGISEVGRAQPERDARRRDPDGACSTADRPQRTGAGASSCRSAARPGERAGGGPGCGPAAGQARPQPDPEIAVAGGARAARAALTSRRYSWARRRPPA